MKEKLTSSYMLFKAFAEPTRLRILHLLRQGELCVCHLMDVFEVPQSRISRHLAYLKRVGLIETREEGTWNYYRLSRPRTDLHRQLLDCVGNCLGEIDELKKDAVKLKSLRIRA